MRLVNVVVFVLSLAICITLGGYAYADDPYLQGTVTADGEPVAYSSVYLSCNGSSWAWAYDYTTTDTNGAYSMSADSNDLYDYSPCGSNNSSNTFTSCQVYAYPPYDQTETLATSAYETVSIDCDATTSKNLALNVKDKTINVSVTAGGEEVISGISVYCSQTESPWTYSSDSTSSGGVYSLSVISGNYNCYANCDYSYYEYDYNSCPYSGNPSTTVTVGDNDVSASLSFKVKNKSIRVAITSGGSSITSGMTASASEQGGGWAWTSANYATDGRYVLSVSTGTYYVSAYCSDYTNCLVNGYPNATVTVEDSDTAVDITLNYLSNNATVSGAVTDGSSAVPNASVSIYSYSVSGDGETSAVASVGKAMKSIVKSGSSGSTMVSSWSQTDSSGAFQMRIPAGTYTVNVSPPWDRTDLAQTSVQITAEENATTSVSIALTQKTASISGTVTDATGAGLSNAYISGWSYSTTGSGDWFWAQTDADGSYSVYGVDGLKYNVSASYWSGDSNSTICNFTNEGMQTVTASSTPQTVDFSFPACDCTVTVNAVDENGSTVSVMGSVNASLSDSTDGMWYGMYGYMSAGTTTMKVISGRELTYSLYTWDSSYVQEGSETATCSDSAGAVNFTMLSLNASISGSYVDDSGTAISTDQYSYISVYTTKDNNYRPCSASSSGFSCQVSRGSWCLGYWVDPNSGFASSGTGSSTSCVEVSDGGAVSSNITLLRTGTISVSVLDSDGNGKDNVWVEATPYSNSQNGANDYQYMYMGSGCMTMDGGSCSINAGASAAGTIYYINAYIPYYTRSVDNLLNPEEVSVTITPNTTTVAEALVFREPDGTSLITVTEGSASSSLSFGISVSKSVINPDEAASSPIANATIDCFSPSGAAFEQQTGEDGTATCPCITSETWRAVAYNIVANNLWLSDIENMTCVEEAGGEGSLVLTNVATLPEGKSMTITDAGTQSLTIELSDGFSVYFPSGSLGENDEQVTCNVDVTVTPFTANRRPASFYGYLVDCKDENGSAIVQLNSNATFTVPINVVQVENIGLTVDDIEMSYYSDSTGAYNSITTATYNETIATITYQQNHLTAFAIIGNGSLVGTDGEEPGGGDNGGGAAASSSGSGGCSLTGGNITPQNWMVIAGGLIALLLISATVLRYAFRRTRR